MLGIIPELCMHYPVLSLWMIEGMNAVINKCSCSLPTIPTLHSRFAPVLCPGTGLKCCRPPLSTSVEQLSGAQQDLQGSFVYPTSRRERGFVSSQVGLFLHSQGWTQTESYFSEPGELWSFPGCQSTAQGEKAEVQSLIHRCASSN